MSEIRPADSPPSTSAEPSAEQTAAQAASATALASTYEVLTKLSEGGMGAIYKVRHRHLNQLRVIKVMKPQLEEGEGFRARFLREAQLEAQMQHTHVAQLYDYAVLPSGVAYMVIEYIDGLTLQQVLSACGPPSVALTLEIASQALAALQYVHDSGSVHRDISPDNLMLTTDGKGRLRLKLIDLGIAKKVEEPKDLAITRTGTFIGKVRYAAPEQFGVQEQLDYRSDLYSFGIVLYELLTGKYPIPGNDTSSLIAGHLFKAPLDFDAADPGGRVSQPLREVVLRALEKKRDDRFGDAREFARALGEIELSPTDVGDELTQMMMEARAVFPEPTASAGETESALWRLLAPATVAVPSPQPVEEEPPRRSRAPLVAGAAVLAAVALGAVLLPRWTSEPPAPPAVEVVAARASITQPIPLGSYHALVIGNDRYGGGLQPLNTAVIGARAVADLLEEEYGFTVQRLFDANRVQLLSAIEEYRALGAEDNLLIYYAGHGRLEGETGYWLPVDAEADNTANWVSNRDISGYLYDLPAKHVLVVADSCYSGTLTGEASAPPTLAKTEDDRLRYIREMSSKTTRLALTSGGQVPVLDRGSGEHSVFTHAFLSVLERNSDVLETSLLYTRVQELVSAAVERLAIELEPGYAQDPEYAPISSTGDEGGDFFFAPERLQA